MPTFGFDLAEIGEPAVDSAMDFAGALFDAVLGGDRELELREVENLFVIPLRVSASLWDFAMTPDQMDSLYYEGLRDARSFFLNQVGPRDPAFMSEHLKVVHDSMLIALRDLGSTVAHLRVNVFMMTNLGRLRLLYSYNMDHDADDRLELSVGEGGVGRCWELSDFVACDLREARALFREKWRMSKYQQAMVRPNLKSLLCTPIFDPEQFTPTKPKSENLKIGILNFDSDDDLLEAFSRKETQKWAAGLARLVAGWLSPRPR